MINTLEAVSLSHYSIADLGYAVAGTLHFPGRQALPPGSVGYVRSEARARLSAAVREGRQRPDAALPWRDYPAKTLTRSADVLSKPFRDDFLLLSCRNVLNEWGYAVRLGGRWWRRAGDPAVDQRWPVLALFRDGARLLAAHEAESTDVDLLTGLPLVIDGRPASAELLIANCSDVAHIFAVHPRGIFGPPAGVWLELSNAWQKARDERLSEADTTASLLAIARRHGVSTHRPYLHSIIAQRADGRLCAFAVTASLRRIAEHLVERWNVTSAILLDNGGSVGWFYCPKEHMTATLLIGGPNRRESGTAFLSLETRGFLQSTMHDSLLR